MYKTVRHGENSLQYTILPQTEEVLNNSGMKGKGRDYSPSIHVRRSRRRSTVKYILLVIFGVIIALALASVPLYIMNDALYAHRSQQDEHEFVTVMPGSVNRDLVKSRKKELKILPEVASTLIVKTDKSSTTTSSVFTSTLPTVVTSETVTLPPWTPVATKSMKSSIIPIIIRQGATEESVGISSIATSDSSHVMQNDLSMKSWDKDIIIRPTVTTGPISSIPLVSSEKSVMNNSKVFDDSLITTKSTTINTPVTTEFATNEGSDFKDEIFALDDDEDFKESSDIDKVFSLSSFKPDTTGAVSDSDEVTIARWPFVDISSYFPWTVSSL